MKIVKERGGHAIAIYQDKDSFVARKLIDDERINFLCRADYSKGKDVERAVKLIFRKIYLNNEIEETILEQSKRLK